MKWDYDSNQSEVLLPSHGLFIINEGNFQYGNSSLSFYDPELDEVYNEIFFQANQMKLGDVAQSMTIFDDKGWIVVNNSHVVFAIDLETCKEIGRIENLTSPRYISFINKEKAYVSQLWDNRIFIVNPKTFSVTGFIDVPDMNSGLGSTEQMIRIGKYIYCNCWSYQNRIIKIDTDTDKVVGSLQIGLQPNSMVRDKNDNLWVLTDGGFEGSSMGKDIPALYCIETDSFSIFHSFQFPETDAPTSLVINGGGNKLYWINNDIWSMDIDSGSLPQSPFLEYKGTRYYALTINPENGDVFVADAIDYMQPGMIGRYSENALLLNEFYVGVTPGAFCWK